MILQDHQDLVIIGTGISIVGQMTTESLAWIRCAERFFYAVNEPIAAEIIRTINAEAKPTSLSKLYIPDVPRRQIYEAMAEQVLSSVREGYVTVAAFYGHPGVFAYPAHRAIAQARAEGYQAQMLPAVSAEDCLFADLGIDPCTFGCQSLEATDFLLTTRAIDTSGYVILWQIGVLGYSTYEPSGYDKRALPLLIEKLSRLYSSEHEVIVYEAATMFGARASMQTLPIARLSEAVLSEASTLFIPPFAKRVLDNDMYNRYVELFPDNSKTTAYLRD